MGIFNFLKPKRSVLDEVSANAYVRRMAVVAEAEQLSARVQNLIAVGRKQDVEKLKSEFLTNLKKECVGNHLNVSEWIKMFVDLSIQLNADRTALTLYNEIIEFHKMRAMKPSYGAVQIDLTNALVAGGRLTRHLGGSCKEEYAYLLLATKIPPPKNCEYPASRWNKGAAHHFAYLCCVRAAAGSPSSAIEEQSWHDRMLIHDKERRIYGVECSWDDPNSVAAWLNGPV